MEYGSHFAAAPIAPLFRDLERDAEAVPNGWKGE